MTDINKLPLFFLSSNSAEGFVSHFPDAYSAADGWRAYIIKGGPGTGKSTCMKTIAKKLSDAGFDVHLAPCTSDPQSLDAVIITELKTIILDGTAPHVVEPKYIGACESLVDFGVSFDTGKLSNSRAEIIAISHAISELYERAYRYIKAAGTLLTDTYRLALQCTDTEKATKFGTSIAERYIPKKSGKGTEKIRFLSGVTSKGLVYYRTTIDKMGCNTIAICDEYGVASGIIMQRIHDIAIERGQDIITCKNPLLPNKKTDHIIIPSLGLAFITSNRYLTLGDAGHKIYARRFTDAAALRLRKSRISFNRRAMNELLENAADTMSESKSLHDELEKYYISSVDFAMVNEITENLAFQIIGG
ncbi:MAG: hypothetical protein PHV07_07825 [Oscillospiraceae bacterium]|nr:hypothetical protein [Oscillospiraceae bacterium]